ncbi:glycosyltransferase [Maritimibacter sp. DP1N21-5]|uniref:glycosyltransferase n=1 Tax=Maritimibacter sp. DP1N21-5 TaxID=2836867 RepID=UPI001C462D60|nr:glycosyltransferase [Maritimibacter sp. DP1N21-5]MBV7407494.1 glycosyltransferase [Maritimibacter sp. DP1N21-5]
MKDTNEERAPVFGGLDVGIVHDWFAMIAGSERVVEQMLKVYPGAPVYTLYDFLTDDERSALVGHSPVHVSALNRLPGVHRYYRHLLLQGTRAIEAFDVTAHDVVLSSSHALAKGVLTAPHQKHIAYVHSPARYAWDLTHEYMASLTGPLGGLKRHLAREMMHRFRLWDMRTAPSVDVFVANSDFIRQRIWKVYRREAEVIYPPVDTAGFHSDSETRQEHFLFASRLVPYKNAHLVVEAFSRRPDLKLKVIGDGSEMRRVRALAGPNVVVLGHVSFDRLRHEMASARALVFAALEDFGIAPVEAQAAGTPVICLGQGGTAETVRPLGTDAPTGVWYQDLTVDSLLGAVDRFIEAETEIRPAACRTNAARFSQEAFRRNLGELVTRTMATDTRGTDQLAR